MGLEKVTELSKGDKVRFKQTFRTGVWGNIGQYTEFIIGKGTTGTVIDVSAGRQCAVIQYDVITGKTIEFFELGHLKTPKTIDKLERVMPAKEKNQYRTALTSVFVLRKGDKVVFIDDYVTPKMGPWDREKVDAGSIGTVVCKYEKPPCVGIEVLAGYGSKSKRLIIAYNEEPCDLRSASENCRRYIARKK